MNKNILISLSIVAVVAAIAIGGTAAYFSSTAVSQNNTFAAGTLNLEAGRDGAVSWSNTPDGLLTLSNMAPGVASQDYIIRFRNTGTIPGQLKIEPGSMGFTQSDIPSEGWQGAASSRIVKICGFRRNVRHLYKSYDIGHEMCY